MDKMPSYTIAIDEKN